MAGPKKTDSNAGDDGQKPFEIAGKTVYATPCTGGLSFDCRHAEHPQSTKRPDIFCYRCQARMGCLLCCDRPSELICLKCHNWAHKAGLERHGNIAPNAKVPYVRTDAGWQHYENNFPDLVAAVDTEVQRIVSQKVLPNL